MDEPPGLHEHGAYWVGFFTKSEQSTAEVLGSKLAWGAVFMALTGTMVRWFESHQIAPDIGHIPVSNLYEVFVLFTWLTTLIYLYYEARFKTRALGAYVMLVVASAVGFLLWYTLERGAHEIQPLVPALQSWWMKIHVPANFVGYGTFALSAMVALASLLKTESQRALLIGLVGVPAAWWPSSWPCALARNCRPKRWPAWTAGPARWVPCWSS